MSCHCLRTEPWKWLHTELWCVWNLIEETCRQLSRRLSPWALRSYCSRYEHGRNMEEKASLQTILCAGLAVDGRCQTSQPHPRQGTTCWNRAIWRVGLPGSDPQCWPIINDCATGWDTSLMSTVLVCLFFLIYVCFVSFLSRYAFLSTKGWY